MPWSGFSSSHTAPLPTVAEREADSSQPPKRPRVSFATGFTLRTFNSGCDDPKKLSSPQEKLCQTGAAEEELTGSDVSGEVTALVPEFSNLIHQDELDTKVRAPKAPANPGPATDRGTPVRTPTTDVETSPRPELEFDLYQQFKGSQEAASQEPKATAGPTAPAPARFAAARSPPPSTRRGLSPDTVDMGGVVEKIHEYGKGRADRSDPDEEPEVPEGRKSFMSTYLGQREGTKSDGSSAPVESVPTPLRSKREGPYGIYKTKKAPQGQGRVPSTSPSPSAGFGAAKSPPGAREVRAQNFADFSGRHKAELAPSLQSPPPTTRRGGVQKAGQERERRSTQVSSVGGEGDSLMYSPTSESALPGSSALQAIPSTASSISIPPDRQVAWEEFLSHCGIAFPPMEQQQEAGSMDAELPSAVEPPTDGCLRSQNAANAFAQKRAQCLQQVVKELATRNEAAHREYNTAVHRWNGSNQQPSASELLEVLEKPQCLELYRNRIKDLQAHCKNGAWLSWYDAKRGYLQKELEAARDQTVALKGELNAVKDACNKLGEVSKKARAMSKQVHHRQTLQDTSKRMTEMAEEELHVAEEDRQLVLRKAPEAQQALEHEQRQLAELEQRVEEARLAAQQSQQDAHQAKRSLLRTKARRVELQQQRYARTCMVTKATATRLDLSLRAGASATVAIVGAANLARIGFHPPRPAGDASDQLLQQLFSTAWRKIVAAMGDQAQASAGNSNEVTVPACDVPNLVRQLDCAALLIADQLDALRMLRKSCGEVVDVTAQLCETDGDSPWLAVSISLIASRSHRVAAGHRGITPLSSTTEADASKCIIEFSSNLEDFPDLVNWADASVRQVFGRPTEDAVRESLQELGRNASLAQAAVAAAQAMNLAAGRP